MDSAGPSPIDRAALDNPGLVEQICSLIPEFAGVKPVFGLAAQGHLPTIERMIDENKSWDDIGQAIGWCPKTAQRHYLQYLRQQQTKVQDGLDKAGPAARRLMEHRRDCDRWWQSLGQYHEPVPGVPGRYFNGAEDIRTIIEFVLSLDQ